MERFRSVNGFLGGLAACECEIAFVGSENRGDGLSELGGYFVIFDKDFFEHRLVEVTPLFVVRALI
nr:hypothetical protein [Arthrobacter sp. TB 23]